MYEKLDRGKTESSEGNQFVLMKITKNILVQKRKTTNSYLSQKAGDKMKVNRLKIENESNLRRALDSVYLQAQEGTHFYGLIEMIKNEQVVLTAIHNIKSNKGSKTAGIDGKVVDNILQMNKNKLIKLIYEAIDDYKPLPTRRVYIPKGNKKLEFKQSDGRKLLEQKLVRPLGIPSMIDRIIQEMIRIVLEPIFEAQFFPHSYGFRPYRSCEHAIGWITRVINKSKLYIALEGDIEGYFDNINHNKLIKIMWNMGVRDKRVLAIIKSMAKAGYVDGAKRYDTTTGTPQGGILSPLLANIYLNYFDWMMGTEYEYHPNNRNYTLKKNALVALRGQGVSPVFYTRYADDWIILTDSVESAQRLKNKAETYLKKELKLKLSPTKTLITDTRQKPAKFLGFNLYSYKQRFGESTVVRAIPDTKKLTSKVKEIKKDIRYLRVEKSERNRQLKIEAINAKIVGLSNYIKIGVAKDIMSGMDNRLEHTAYKTWTSMYGKYKAKELKIPLKYFDNRKDRHEDYELKHFAIKHGSLTVGLTFFKITPIKYAEVYKQEMTPYTPQGRKLYHGKLRTKSRLLLRPNLTHPNDIWLYTEGNNDSRYNFEYFLNREYTYNRDRGYCKCCKIELNPGNYRCHHINNKLPMNEINKVKNLASVCSICLKAIHNTESTENKKVEKYRKILATA